MRPCGAEVPSASAPHRHAFDADVVKRLAEGGSVRAVLEALFT